MRDVSLYERVLGDATDERLRGWAINAAIAGFLLHVLACTLHQFTAFDVPDMNGFFDSYLDALYTPFSIILAYEVYELIRAIPESFSISIGKQFEVMSLLVVRDMFKNLADVENASMPQRCNSTTPRNDGFERIQLLLGEWLGATPVHHLASP